MPLYSAHVKGEMDDAVRMLERCILCMSVHTGRGNVVYFRTPVLDTFLAWAARNNVQLEELRGHGQG